MGEFEIFLLGLGLISTTGTWRGLRLEEDAFLPLRWPRPAVLATPLVNAGAGSDDICSGSGGGVLK